MKTHKFESEDEFGTPNSQPEMISSMNFRARDAEGRELYQKYVGECWAWLAQGEDITIEPSTGRFDRNGDEIFAGDKVYIHYKDKSLATVKFGSYPNCQATADIIEPHTGFYLEDPSGVKVYIGLLNDNSEIVS
jgi:hypothetical protein